MTGVLVIAGSALWLVLSGNTGIRYSADHDGTVPMWVRWIPVAVAIALVRFVPARPAPDAPHGRRTGLEAGVLLAAAVLFAVVLAVAGGGEPAHTVSKLVLLLVVPVLLFRWSRDAGEAGAAATVPWWTPVPAVAAWFALSYAGPWAVPTSDYAFTVDVLTLVATLVVGFLVNSLLEEVFYRRWLQTRWEALLGPWPAIVLTSLLWAAWHVGIQGTGDLPSDLAATFVNQGVAGLFLGYLWSRYRLTWPLITVHGAMNAAPILLPLW
ncbi:CPBP family intramembrane glutamic endopeptidase [Amycolatopsis sp. NPDC006131]|uniref:CPBP family intramembrane glutamic endopeptidase n=1 Tax=Amycolatopsis sp. NPDC006131 TaxID=3156731 RepID=UPI0033BC50DD